MLAYLLVRVECHLYHLTSQQGPAFDRLQGCSQVNNLLSLTIMHPLSVHANFSDISQTNNLVHTCNVCTV